MRSGGEDAGSAVQCSSMVAAGRQVVQRQVAGAECPSLSPQHIRSSRVGLPTKPKTPCPPPKGQGWEGRTGHKGTACQNCPGDGEYPLDWKKKPALSLIPHAGMVACLNGAVLPNSFMQVSDRHPSERLTDPDCHASHF